MIPLHAIHAWQKRHPWPNLVAVEQDLLLARLMVEIAQHPYLGSELVMRGGTCLHQLVLPQPRRYSEDLDFVRTTHTGVGNVFDALREIADKLSLRVLGTTVGEHPKMRLRADSETDPLAKLRIKIEMNTHETSPAFPTIRLPFTVDNSWFSGSAQILTFSPTELFATKIRALYQRRKGRDLYDLWLALTELGLRGVEIASAFHPYRPVGLTAALAEDNLRQKVTDEIFCHDLSTLLVTTPSNYRIEEAAELVIAEVYAHLDDH
jgi:hypothetical protein